MDNWDSYPLQNFIRRCKVIVYNLLLSLKRKNYKICVCCGITQFASWGLVRSCFPHIPALRSRRTHASVDADKTTFSALEVILTTEDTALFEIKNIKEDKWHKTKTSHQPRAIVNTTEHGLI